MERKKSELQRELERDGWRFLHNVPIIHPLHETAESIRERYLEAKEFDGRKFEEVRIADAYNFEGNSLNTLDFKAVYVR